MARFAIFARATLAWIAPRLKFRVMPKGAPIRPAVRLSLPQWLMLVGNFAAVPARIALYAASNAVPLNGLVTNVLWTTVNGCPAAAVRQRFTRSRYRFPVPVAATLAFADRALHRHGR